MALKVDWYEPDRRTIHICFDGRYTQEEFEAATARWRQLEQSAAYHPPTLLDFSHMEDSPSQDSETIVQLLNDLALPQTSMIGIVGIRDYRLLDIVLDMLVRKRQADAAKIRLFMSINHANYYFTKHYQHDRVMG